MDYYWKKSFKCTYINIHLYECVCVCFDTLEYPLCDHCYSKKNVYEYIYMYIYIYIYLSMGVCLWHAWIAFAPQLVLQNSQKSAVQLPSIVSVSFTVPFCSVFPLLWGFLCMRSLRFVGSLKLYVSFAQYRFFYRALLQKRPVIWRSLRIEASPYCLSALQYFFVREVGGWGRDPKKCTGRGWGWGRVPFNEPYAPSLSTIYDGA